MHRLKGPFQSKDFIHTHDTDICMCVICVYIHDTDIYVCVMCVYISYIYIHIYISQKGRKGQVGQRGDNKVKQR